MESVIIKGQRAYRDLTPEYLCKIMGIENKEQDLGLSIRSSVKFFEKFHLGLVVVNIYDDVIFKYTPQSKHNHIHPNTLYVLVYNSHCYKLNSNENSFVHKLNLKEVVDEEKETYDNLKNKLSTNFYFRNFDKESKKIFINNLNDAIKYITDNEQKDNIIFITNTDLTDILFEMVDNKYIPYTQFECGILKRLCFKLKNVDDDDEAVIYSIEHGDSSMVENEIMTVEADEIKNYDKADRLIYEWLLNKNNLSQRNDYIRSIEKAYPIAPLCGYFDGCDLDCEYNTADFNKAYTSNAKDIENIPTFNNFDIFLTYDGHKIEDYTQYIIYCCIQNDETAILFKKTYSRCYGYKLNRISDDIQYNILFYRRPSRLNKSYSDKYIEDLYNIKISENNLEDIEKKKFIMNKNLGLIEKKYNKKSITKIYHTMKEAQYYQIKYGGNIYRVTHTEFQDQELTQEEKDEGILCRKTTTNRELFILVNKVQKDLEESFNPIKDLIYDIQLLKLWKLYRQLTFNDIKVYGIKTDCLLVSEEKETLKNVVEFSKNIGGIKFEYNKKPISKKIVMFKNELIEFKQPEINIIEMKDEYDVNEMKEILQKYDRVMIKGLLPGSGKTTAIKNSDYKTLFITPYNKLCQELRKEKYDSITLNKLLNINICGDVNKYSKTYDTSSYEAVCFDEILLYNTGYLNRINNFINKTDKKVYATGDVDQLQPFGFQLNNVQDKTAYLNKIIDMMFPNQIILKYNKRLRTKEDQEKLSLIKQDIFNNKLDIADVMKKYFKTITKFSELKTTKNLSFFNFRNERINKYVQDHLIKPPENAVKFDNFYHYQGLEIVCKKHYRVKNIRLYTNYTYVLDNINTKKFTVVEPVENVKMTMDIDLLKKHFKPPYCNTVHSVQGLSIDDDITVFDCNTPYTDRHFVWTAITRARSLDKIIYFHHSENEVKRLEESRKNQFLKLKIDFYKRQDMDAKRDILKDKYIDVAWFADAISQVDRCSLCGCKYYMVLDESNNIFCNISVDRLDNNGYHSKDNCHLLCIECNKSKK